MVSALLVSPSAASASRPVASNRPVAIWLFGISFMLLVMIALGGATRLTGSGLSIMEWAPLMGALPPLREAEWQRLYALYQQIPQYALLNHGFGIEGFKSIFWLEWTHRLWGRLVGVVFLLPLVGFALRGRISRALGLRLGLLFLLGGLQGGLGWFMVASGFAAGSTSVSAYRLVIHLVLALSLYAAILWTALGLWQPRPGAAVPGLRRRLTLAAALVGTTIVAGGFVAGLHAGLVYNSFPLMGGGVLPPDYAAMHPFLRNLTENVAAVQFDHRLLAMVTVLLVLSAVVHGLRRGADRVTRAWLLVLAALVVIQFGLGVSTLLHMVPVGLAVLHQATAILLLSAVLACRHRQRRPG